MIAGAPGRAGHNSQPLPQLNGVLVLNKPSGPTSVRCLAAIKRLGQRKIGHAGTLDPLASGVLLALLGQATKLSPHLLAGGHKVYRGMLRLGQVTDTWDCEGKILTESPWDHISVEDVLREVALWREVREQSVPPYSAAKHEGRPLYALARKGRDVPQKVKRTEISQVDTFDVRLPFVSFRVTCSSGTYIRSLAHSLGMRLGCGAVLTELTREYSHPFGLDVSCDLQDIENDSSLLVKHLHPVAEVLPDWTRVELTPDEAALVRNGMHIPRAPTQTPESENALLLYRGDAFALARRAEGASLRWTVLRGLWN
ncbi:MAG: tRNA pseudouridine(55) synthase TruB [Desulfovibrio sp.]|jgi:tRNA pseudouridine55 synthase|nr:tRNA pseudouridine(55) synthase TruB [Desulfovibrio sp.]